MHEEQPDEEEGVFEEQAYSIDLYRQIFRSMPKPHSQSSQTHTAFVNTRCGVQRRRPVPARCSGLSARSSIMCRLADEKRSFWLKPLLSSPRGRGPR
ncbi:hypothetical protein EYF80_024714 [Liparis tanakae]|uniref:Uncharacterized protein n=1 Tax=Liparis tanakae TaxID=230148 RepID=A0A4Z2HIK9_9TELE|nr:hypothetical protein EYF80_024714 [Liparis tanakae]